MAKGHKEDLDADIGPDEKQPGEMTKTQSFAHGAKVVLGKVIKWALIGALVGAVLFGGFTLLAAHFGAQALPWGLGSIAEFFVVATGNTANVVGALAGAPTLYGALWGGGIAAALGGVLGFAEASDSIEQENERRVSRYEQNELRREKRLALAQQRDQMREAMGQQEQDLAMNPGAMRGRGRMGREPAESLG